jgi:MFS family permease
MSSATYRTLLRTHGAAAFFLTAAVGRVGIAMTSLGIVWLVHARTGSYATAGLVTGGFAVAEAVAGPQLARLADRFGQTRVLPPALLAHAGAVTTLLTLVAAGSPDWLMTAGGVLAGATIPQLGALSAARWAALLRDGRATALPTAFALESLANELAYLAGPALVSILGASGYPAAGTVLAAVLVVGGGMCFAAQRRTAPEASAAAGGHRTGRDLLRPGFAVLGGVNLAIGGFFGAMQISVTAFALEHGAAGIAAALFTVSSCASLLAGWLYGLRQWRTVLRVQLAVAAGGLTIGCLPLLLARSPVELGFGVALTGLAVPLILILCSLLAEASVHRAVLTQAFAWLNSASAAGSAGAAAATGWAVDTFGTHGGLAVAAIAAGAMAVLALTGVRALRVPQQPRSLQATPASDPSTSSGQQPRHAEQTARTPPGR